MLASQTSLGPSHAGQQCRYDPCDPALRYCQCFADSQTKTGATAHPGPPYSTSTTTNHSNPHTASLLVRQDGCYQVQPNRNSTPENLTPALLPQLRQAKVSQVLQSPWTCQRLSSLHLVASCITSHLLRWPPPIPLSIQQQTTKPPPIYSSLSKCTHWPHLEDVP